MFDQLAPFRKRCGQKTSKPFVKRFRASKNVLFLFMGSLKRAANKVAPSAQAILLRKMCCFATPRSLRSRTIVLWWCEAPLASLRSAPKSSYLGFVLTFCVNSHFVLGQCSALLLKARLRSSDSLCALFCGHFLRKWQLRCAQSLVPRLWAIL